MCASASSARPMKILPNPIFAWASARLRSSSSARSHLAMPSAARLVHRSTSPSHIWPRGWSGTDDRALINFASAAARAAAGSVPKRLMPSTASARRSHKHIDVTGVGDKRPIETPVCLRHVLRGVPLIDPGHALKIEVHRIGGWHFFRASSLGGDKLVVERAGETGDDLVLHVKEIGERLVEPLGPKMIAFLGVDELHIDAHAIAAALYAALDDIADVQLAPNCLHVEQLAFVGKRRISGDYDAASYARKIGREALSDSVDEMLRFGIATQVGERQHDHREARRLPPVRHRGSGLHRLTFRAGLERLGSHRRGKFIALARHGHDETRRLRAGLKLAAQPADQHVDAAIEKITASASSRYARLNTRPG
jgi:hypothetical protein